MSYIKNNFANSSQIESEGEINQEGKKVGKWIHYFYNGNINCTGYYENDLAQGEWTFYSENGIIQSKGSYEKGQWHGPWEWYNDEGILREKGSYKNGQLHGHHIWFFQNGKVNIEGYYDEGHYSGEWKWYNEEGILVQRSHYEQGKLHGISEIFNDDGSTREVNHYHNGVKHGEQIIFQGGKKKVTHYEMGFPALKETAIQKLAEKIRSKKDHYQKQDVIIKKFGYDGLVPVFWYLVDNNHIELDADIVRDIASEGAEVFFTAPRVLKILQKIDLNPSYRTAGLTKYWSTYLDRMVFYAYLDNPRLFDEQFETFTKQAKKGYCLVMARAGKPFPETYKKEILQDIAEQVALFGYVGKAINDKNGIQETLYSITENQISEFNIINNEDKSFNSQFYKFLENFGSQREWQNALLSACLNPNANIIIERCLDAFKIANIEQFCQIIKRIYSGYSKIYELFALRDFSIEELEKAASLLDEGWRKGFRAEIAIVMAILKLQKQSKPVPTWYDEWLELNGFYWGETNGIKLDGLSYLLQALQSFDKERVQKIILKKLQDEYEWVKIFAFINFLDTNTQDQIFTQLLKLEEKNLYNNLPIILALKDADLSYLEKQLAKVPSNTIACDILVASIVLHLADLVGKKGSWNEKYDKYISIHVWKPDYQDDFEHYLLPYYKQVTSYIDTERLEKILLPQINPQESTFARVFGLFNEATSIQLLQKAAEALASASNLVISKAQKYVYYFVVDYRESISPVFVEIALQKNVNNEVKKWFQDGFGDAKYGQILQKLGMKPTSQSLSRAEITAQLIEEYFKLKPNEPSTTIYYLEPLHNQKPEVNYLNYVGGKAPISDDLIPKVGKKKMEHIFTLDIRTVPLLAERLPKDTAALSFFVLNPDNNHAYQPFNKSTKTLFLKESDILKPESLADSYTFSIKELKVPKEIFRYECSQEAQEIRKKVYQASCYVLGEPMWVQGEEHEEGNFLLQFDENFAPVNLGDNGLMYVFEDTAFWQCY
ncbi:toxin-antitoxin system YwqK family antitoxin [Raineya orbicola]|uniref:MORN repeat variant n=1 Tax=Raineya orbicola TaxID=2016530 RepID=A0A2N3IK75_9BACT|nr:toxin-antitoxin system YwqK family antitoxin [Raineya orbicola]PKQ70742.1 MORN repeat variant [Raineya orbicola]